MVGVSGIIIIITAVIQFSELLCVLCFRSADRGRIESRLTYPAAAIQYYLVRDGGGRQVSPSPSSVREGERRK